MGTNQAKEHSDESNMEDKIVQNESIN